MKRSMSPAEKFWIGLGAYVLAADVYLWRHDHDTMSIQFGSWLKTRNGRAACITASGGMIVHLFYGMPLPMQRQAKRYLGGKKCREAYGKH